VPGTWVQPPQVGFLWTPGYWGFVNGVYAFNAGYWGPHIGFYGGVNYGYGYVGVGFAGGHWDGGRFAYNTAVTNVNVTVIHNTYNQTVVNNVTVNRVSYNGGAGGVAAVPTAQERAVAQEHHVPPTPVQVQHAHANGGHPAIAATAKPAVFNGPGVVAAHGAPPLPASKAVAENSAAGAHPPGQPAVHANTYAPPPAVRAGAPAAQAPHGAAPPVSYARPPAAKAPPAPPKPQPQQKKNEPDR